MNFIYKYEKYGKYNYLLEKDYTYKINFLRHFENKYIKLVYNKLVVKQNYRWDGASGPAINTTSFIKGSLIHDAMYQILRECNWSNKDKKAFRLLSDKTLVDICESEGMGSIRRFYVYYFLRIFGGLYNKF